MMTRAEIKKNKVKNKQGKVMMTILRILESMVALMVVKCPWSGIEIKGGEALDEYLEPRPLGSRPIDGAPHLPKCNGIHHSIRACNGQQWLHNHRFYWFHLEDRRGWLL